jgi:DNA invertase Pin-like site-specific DNA recombinase
LVRTPEGKNQKPRKSTVHHVNQSQFAADLEALTKPRVYTYTRFSTPEQAQGDSYRRQTEAAARWASKRGYVLDDALSFFDEGVSAYRGSNAGEDRGLGRFLYACRTGLIPAGSYFVVESLDRVSRMPPRKAQRLIDDIVDNGVTIVTLSDNQEYTAERLDSDPTALLIALMVAWRANEESKTKAKRLSEAWAEKRRKLAAGEPAKYTKTAPAWLRWQDDQWAIDPAKGDVVRRIFDMTLAGVGENKIAAVFNQEGVPVMERGKMWHRSTVAKILRNPATIGTLVPGRMEDVDGKRKRVLEEPVKGVYPAVIDVADWTAARGIKDGKTAAVRGRGAKVPLANVLSGLARCPDCGAAVTRVNKGNPAKAGKPKLVCTRAKAGAEKHYKSVPLEPVQEAVLSSWPKLMADVPAGDQHSALDAEQRDLEGTLSALHDHLADLSELLDRQPSQTVAARIRQLEQEQRTLQAMLHQVDEQRANADGGFIHARLAALGDAMGEDGEPVSLERANAALRILFAGVTVDHHRGVLDFHWKQGGTTTVLYEWVN